MSEYLIINIATVIVPLLMSFEKQLRFYRFYLPLFISILLVGSVFVIWDHQAAIRGDWNFNEKYILGIILFELPLEEIFFFITVPYSIIFLYESMNIYLPDKTISLPKWPLYIAILLLLVSAFLFINQYYTFTVLLFTAISLFLLILDKNLLHSRNFLWFILFTYLPFLVVNYFLTSLPIVQYSPGAIWGFRFITIPLEDFFYSFSLLSLYLLTYLKAKQILIK
jgi:lycopene cyclase domain-containing protein